MNKSRGIKIAPRKSGWSRVLPSAVALVGTLLALPIQAVTVPNLPLQTGAAYPPPNIMFILDDSGSMQWDFMPGANSSSEVPATAPVNVALNAYTRNTLYYNPNITYQPWIKSDNTRFNTGTSYTSAWSDDSQLSSAINLANTAWTFYAPRPGATDMAATASYYRYQIPVGGADMVRSQYAAVVTNWTTVSVSPSTYSASSGGMLNAFSFSLPANVTELQVTLSGGTKSSGSGADLYVQRGSWPGTGSYDCRSRNSANDEVCDGSDSDLTNPNAGTWYVGINRASNYSNVTLSVRYSTDNRCGTGSGANDWVNCTSATPTGRALSAELTNYAIWYSYHRTRIKTAKAGASEAFSQMGSNLRVGYDTIWNRSRFTIPVGTNQGQFTGTNRDTWFSRLQAADGNNGTPLKGALQRTGEYFTDTSSTGPWGPETGANQISCRQNFAILTTDGYWNDNTGYTAVGDTDGVAGTTITNTAGASYTYSPTFPYKEAPTLSNTLADVAMYYWKRDLVTGLENNVPTSVADPAFWQHMVTFSVSIGQKGNLDPDTDLPYLSNGTKRWGNPNDAEDADRIDDLWHAAVNGRGNFVTASNPTEFAQGLVDALATVAARLGSASNVTSNSTSFQTDTRLYQASYVSGKWSGELAAFSATSAGMSSTPVWRASSLIPTSGRNILTWNGSAGRTFPTASQTSALVRTGGLAPATGAENAAYIAGSRTLERRNGGGLRDRDVVLGDIVNSSPIYVKDSESIFVGANDGMLHAVDALTGAERFAYVPGGINLGDLATLSDPQYTHRYFVDGPIVVSTLKQTPGKNYLVGALGRGGKGVFGLDVTNPASFGVGNVLWERTSDTNMGQVLGEPLVVKLNNGVNGILVSNGINSSSGHATLFVLNIADGSVIKEIDTGNQGADNGLSAPRGWDNDGNGTVDYVYAGDLKGNLWKFDLTGSAPSSWTIANSGSPMFVATDASNKRQPITAGLALAKDPSTGRRWIFIGTGAYLSTGDVSDMSIQSMYGVVDDGTVVTARTSGGDGDLVQRQIVQIGTANGKTIRGFEPPASTPSTKKGWYIDMVKPPSATREGERIVSNPRVRGTVLLTASLIPPTTNTCDAGGSGFINAMDAFSGASVKDAAGNAVSYFDVNRNGNLNDDKIGSGTSQVGIGSVDLGVGNPTLPALIGDTLFDCGSNGTCNYMLTNGQGGAARRLSWREILKD